MKTIIVFLLWCIITPTSLVLASQDTAIKSDTAICLSKERDYNTDLVVQDGWPYMLDCRQDFALFICDYTDHNHICYLSYKEGGDNIYVWNPENVGGAGTGTFHGVFNVGFGTYLDPESGLTYSTTWFNFDWRE